MDIYKHMTEADLAVVAAKLKDEIDWSHFPKLAAIFQDRSPQNIYWLELVVLMIVAWKKS